MKNVAVLTKDGAVALFFRPHPGDLTAQESPCNPREFATQGKKNANARVSARWWGWTQVELTDVLFLRI